MKQNQITELFKSYLCEIDDYYEAKSAFIDDLNAVFAKKGDKGVVCKNELVYAFDEHIKKFLE